MRVSWNEGKSAKLMHVRGFSFKDATEIFNQPHVIQHKNDRPEQYKVIGMVKGRLITLIVETRFDMDGEYEWFVTLWKSTTSEAKIYEENI